MKHLGSDRPYFVVLVVEDLTSRQDQPQVGHYTDSDAVLSFIARAGHLRLAAAARIAAWAAGSSPRRPARGSRPAGPGPNCQWAHGTT